MRSDGVNDFWRLPMGFRESCTTDSMTADSLGFGPEHLPNVMEQGRSMGRPNVQAQLFGHQAAEMCCLKGMLPLILSVTGSIEELSDEKQNFGVNTFQAKYLRRPLPCISGNFLKVFPRLLRRRCRKTFI